MADDGRRKLHELDEMTNVCFLFNPESQEEGRCQAERLLSNICETLSSAAPMLIAVLTDLTTFQY
jgi:hypothetical protein